jgi:hypothetical protein
MPAARTHVCSSACRHAAALLELAAYYKAAGQRTKLSPEVRDSVLRHLDLAQTGVPKQEEKVLGLF